MHYEVNISTLSGNYQHDIYASSFDVSDGFLYFYELDNDGEPSLVAVFAPRCWNSVERMSPAPKRSLN